MREARPIHPACAITVGIKAKDIIGIEHALIFDAEPIIVLPIAFRVCLGCSLESELEKPLAETG